MSKNFEFIDDIVLSNPQSAGDKLINYQTLTKTHIPTFSSIPWGIHKHYLG